MSTRIIIDTNIIISLEENAIVAHPLAELHALLQANGVQVLVHPASLEDIQNDRDEDRRNIKLSKLQKYVRLDKPPQLDLAMFQKAGINIGSANDEIDCTILTSLAKDAAHFLLTEDRKLHGKARTLGLADRVFTVDQALALFKVAYQKQPIRLPNLDLIYLHEIRDELADKLFDSLRVDYDGFDDWFVRCCQQGRQAWIARDPTGRLGAICIYKDEQDELVSPGHVLHGKVLKLCAFKVEENVRGQKLGELLLKAAFRHATKNDFQKVYVTVKEKHTHLVELLADFGFESVGINKDDDTVFVKDHPKHSPSVLLDPVTYHTKYSPHFKGGSNVGKFLVPIQPNYHEQLFPDADESQLKLALSRVLPGNAIKLAYLCKANTKAIKPGDVLVFYRSHDWKACTTFGIVEWVDRLNNPDIILEKVLKRTVYSRVDIERICRRGCLVLLFRLQAHFPVPVGMTRLEKLGILGPIQSIRKITDEQFRQMAKHGEIENYISTD